MPWSSKSVIETRQQFVSLATLPGANIRALCRQFEVSPKTAYKFLARVKVMGEQEGCRDISRRPHRSPRKFAEAVEKEVIGVRAAHPQWGGRRIEAELRRGGHERVPSPSTITAILRRNLRLARPDCRQSTIASLPLEWPTTLAATRRERFPSATDAELQVVFKHLLGVPILKRRRAMVLLAHWLGVRQSSLCSLIGVSPVTWRRCLRKYAEGGVDALFAPRRSSRCKIKDTELKTIVFDTLHRPPSQFGINRTTWKLADLRRVLARYGHTASEETLSTIIKSSGYRWRKARVVLTSNDPEFSAKLDRIQWILGNLAPDEAFFSIDEFGPFAVKDQPGRSLTPPGEQRLVQQWQKSRGTVLLTAALELASNQVTHVYSEKKNTAEMIRMMKVLADKYRDRRCIYLSWDAASWHMSKELNEAIHHHNSRLSGPSVVVAPLPARAQFLNVIESVFSGMARAIIHSSNYQSPAEAKAAIDRYFEERNAHFEANPRRAGSRIWGKERVPAEFSPSNNCKDPCLG